MCTLHHEIRHAIHESWYYSLKYCHVPESGKLNLQASTEAPAFISGASTSRWRHLAGAALHCLALPCCQAQAARLLREWRRCQA